MFRPESRSDAEIEAALWQEVEEAREAERAEELNEPVTDVEPTAEAPAQESIVEPTKPSARLSMNSSCARFTNGQFAHLFSAS